MKKIWENYKEVFILLAYAAFLIGLFVFIAKPLFSQIQEKRKYAEEKAVEKEITDKKIKELPQLKEKMAVIQQEEAKLNVFFSQENALPLIEKIETLAAETGNGIKIEIISEGGSSKDDARKNKDKDKEAIMSNLPGANFIIVRLSLSGDFNSAARFIQKIENFDYFSDIISIKMSRIDRGDSRDRLKSGSGFFNSNAGENEKEADRKTYKYETPLEVILETAFYQKK